MTESKTSKERPSARTMYGMDCAEQGISRGGEAVHSGVIYDILRERGGWRGGSSKEEV